MRHIGEGCTCIGRPIRAGRVIETLMIALVLALGMGMTAGAYAGGCPDGQIEDCCGTCAPAGWLGDADCDAGQWTFNGVPIYFNCPEVGCDNGDCDGVCDFDPSVCPVKGECPAGQIEDCNGNCAPAGWLGDADCDAGQWSFNGIPIFLNCSELNCDNGDCGPDQCDLVSCPDCAADLDESGSVGVPDLLALLACWGDVTEGCECADLDGSGAIGVPDLLELLAQWGDCPEPVICGEGAGDCCSANGTPGCDNVECCETVCAADPFCCDTEWDTICAGTAQELCPDHCEPTACPPGQIEDCCGNCAPETWVADGFCDDGSFTFNGVPIFLNCDEFACDGGDCPIETCEGFDPKACPDGPPACGDPAAGDCFVANGTPACDDEECCLLVCAADAFCCETAWDGLCASAALTLCGEPPANDNCEDRIAIFDGDTEFSTIGATTDGPDLPLECEEGAGLAFGQDIWFNYVATQTGSISFSTCGQAGYDTRLALYEGCECGEDTVPPASDCCVANGTVGCDDQACQDTVCALDAFCCETEWDQLCADAAAANCGDLCEAGGGEGWNLVACNDDGPGCSGFSSCLVAEVVEGQCYKLRVGGFATAAGNGTLTITPGASECEVVPPDVCGEGAGDCCSANGTPGCDDEACCTIVCAADAFCCDTSWDGLCSGAALTLCEVCQPECNDCEVVATVEENELCGESNNDGCGGAPPTMDFQDVNIGDIIHGYAWADANTRDTDWYRVTVPASGNVSGTVTAAGPTVVFIVSGDWNTCGGVAVIGEIGHSQDCVPATAAASGLTPGSEVVVFVAFGTADGGGIFAGFPCGSCENTESGSWEYTVEIGEEEGPGPVCGDPASGDCFIANGTPGCDDADCCNAVCAQDAFCCGTAWDQLCADAAIQICGAASCDCQEEGGLGCAENLDCEACVCGIDDFCCDTEWDSVCAGLAANECSDACCSTTVPSDCCFANGTPGCNDPDCNDLICALAPFCCNTS